MKTNNTVSTLMLSVVFLFVATALSYGQTTTLEDQNFDNGLGSWVSGGDRAELLPANQLQNQGWATNGTNNINYNNNSCDNLTGNVIALRGSNNSNRILTSPSYDMAGYDKVIFDYDYFVSSMDSNTEGWNLDYSNDNGSSWVTVKTYRRDSQFDNLDCGPNDYGNKEVVILDNATYSFTDQSKFRMYTERDNGNVGDWDYLVIDNVTLTGITTSTCSASGTILMERYDGISGTSISDLTGSANYPNNPSSSAQLTSFEIPANVAENYGARVSGYICAPETGYYTFWMTSDDNGELNLSTDDDPANKTTIAYVTQWTPQNVWDDEPNQKSNPVLLIAGNSYYVEALMKEAGGGDHLAIGWAKPGETTTAPSQIIPGSVLSPVVVATCADAVTLPWNEGFETVNNNTYTSSNSNVGNCWEYQEDNVGRLRFDQVSHTGSKAALLDTDNNSGTQNYLTKTINLSDYTTATDLVLSFWFFDGADENHADDAVWIRGNNTASWIKIYDILPQNFTDRQWNQITDLDIDSILASNGQVVSSTFQIRLGQYDNYFYQSSGSSSDGIAFDDIEITGSNCAPITTYNITGDDLSICSGSSETTAIGLDGSESGVTYQLLKDGVDEGTAIAGTGNSISFGDFGTSGTYTIEATRTDGGCTQTMTGNVIVTDIAIVDASFNTSATSIEVGESINFTDTSTGSPTSWSWDFDGDGIEDSTDQNPTHTFNTAGTYLVTLTATNSSCSDTTTTSITVTNAPVDLFFEDFEDENQNATNGTDAYGTNWDTNEQSSDPDDFKVKDNEFKSKRTRGEAILFTETINISNYTDLKLSSFIEFRGDMESDDFIKFQYKLNGGALVDVPNATYEDDNYSDTTYEWPLTGITGTTLEMYITFKTNGGGEEHRIDNIKLTGVIDCSSTTNDITDATATAGDTQASLSWSNPNVACYSIDEVMVVAKADNVITTVPSGDGSAYTANATFGSGTAFDGGYVVYKGTAEAVSITGLTNGTTYHLTTFTREGTTWSSGVTVTVTPIESPYLFFEDFEDEADEAIIGTDVNGIGWSATLNGHNANYFGVDTQSSNKLFRADNLENTGIKWESNTINIAGKTDLELSAYLEFDGTDDGDYLRVKVLVDGFFATTVASFDDDVDDQDGNKSWLLVDNSGDPITGNTLKIIIEFFHDSNDEYLVDNIRLTDGNYWLGNESDLFTNTEKWSYKEVPTATSTAKIANGAHLKLSNMLDVTVKNFTVNGELTIEKDASLTTTEDFKNTGTTILNSGHDEFSSLLVQGTATGSISYNRWVNNYEAGTNGNDVIASPVTGESWSSVMSNNGASIYNNGVLWSFTPYINGTANWGDFYTSSTSVDIISGKGYRVSSPPGNSQTVKFTGEIVNGAVTVQLSRNQTRWNVVGNPYSTYIDLATFIQVNQAQLDEGYVLVLGYNGVNNTDGWAYYNLSTALASNIKIAPGQGFYLAAKNNNSTVVFNPSMKTVSGADDFLQDGARSAVLDMQKLRLNINNGNKARHAEFYFFNRDDVSDSFDLGYDALIKNDGDNFNLYSTPLDGTVNKLAIQTSHLDNMETSIIPVGVEAQAGQQLTFSIDNLNIADNIIIWLEDRATGVWTEMNDGSTYILNTTETISGTGRFYIHFENGDTLNIKEVETNQINIVSISGNKTIVVNGNLESDSILELYDINGRKVLTKNLERYTTTHRIDARHLPTAPYIVTIRNQVQNVSKQIIIN